MNSIANPPALPLLAPAPPMNARIRYAQVTVFVVVWMSLGWLLHLRDEAYVLLGVPLVVIFQTAVRRRPLRELWVRVSERFHLGATGVITAVGFVILPAFALVVALFEREWVQTVFLAAACFGACGVGFSMRHLRQAFSKKALRPFSVALLVGIGSMAIAALSDGQSPSVRISKLPEMFVTFLTLVPVCFALEEVVFRGALDTHVWMPEGSRTQAWISAFLVSSLWGLWHLPIVEEQAPLSLLSNAPVLVLFHAIDGAFIAFSWRASGTLLLPAIYHSLTNAYRDAIFP